MRATLLGPPHRELGLLVTDFDRTLTDPELRVVPAALAEIERLRNAGLPVVLATGRHEAELRPLGILERFDHLVLEGGALVGTPDRLVPQPGTHRVGRLAEWCDQHGIDYQRGAASMSTVVDVDPRLIPVANELSLQVVRNHDRFDITASGISKGSAVRQLRRWLLPEGEVLAVGDGENDIELFAASHYKVAVSNAHPRLAAVADEVTATPGGAGIAEFLSQRVHVGRPTRPTPQEAATPAGEARASLHEKGSAREASRGGGPVEDETGPLTEAA